MLIAAAQDLVDSLDEALEASRQDLKTAEKKIKDPECLPPMPGKRSEMWNS